MHIEKRALTYPQLIGYAIIIIVQAFTAGALWTNLQGKIATQEEKIDDMTTTIGQIKTQVEPVANLVYRLGQNEARDDAQDERIDRIVDSINAKLDGLVSEVGALRTDVRVLTQRVDISLNGAKPTSLRVRP